MPNLPRRRNRSVDTDSRTSAVGRKRSASSSKLRGSTRSQHQPSRKTKPIARSPRWSQQQSNKRRKHSQEQRKPNEVSTVGSEDQRDFVTFSSLQDTDFAQGEGIMSVNGYGRNRLKSGFISARSASTEGSDDSVNLQHDSRPIEIDTTDDEGGITLNIDDNDDDPIVISDDDDTEGEDARTEETIESEEGEIDETRVQQDHIRSAEDTHMSSVNEHMDGDVDEASFIVDSTSTRPQVYLKDLNPDQLEDQIKYAFWQLKRDQIDLSRLARCLHCQTEGHIDEDCPEKRCTHCGAFAKHDSALCPQVRRCETCRQPGHLKCDGMKNNTIPCDLCLSPGHSESTCVLKHYPKAKIPSTEKVQLWISCASCASKTHLVGDCPELRSARAARWSLKSLDPSQIVNLSVQKGIDKLERDAQNRGMRPEGLQIRGTAARHNADRYRQDDSDSGDLGDFFSHPPAPHDNRRGLPPPRRGGDGNSYRPEYENKYDRYTAPNAADSYRPPRSAFYATDSFGRPRSRSPPRFAPRTARRSPSPSYDSYRPDDRSINTRSSPPRTRSNLPARPPPTIPKPAPGITINLPTRKGSNTNIKGTANTAPTVPATNRLPKKPPTKADKSNWNKFQRSHNGMTRDQYKKFMESKGKK